MKIKNGLSYKQDGWIYISINGKPRERGYAYGYLSANEFKEIKNTLDFFIYESYGIKWSDMVKQINDDFKEYTKENFLEFYEEMEGIAEGCISAGVKTDIDEIIAWNFYLSISYWYSIKSGNRVGKEGGGAMDRCSAFIAVGDYTSDGKIVVAHNSFAEFIDGQYWNVILDLKPDKGNRILMQTAPCWIWSGSDFFITSAGIIGTETTIGGFMPYEQNIPIGYRIRKAMQYGNNLDDYVNILIEGNSGDYASSWLFGDTNTNEILRIELGLKYTNVERTKNGMFIGFNAPYDPRIRNLECENTGFYDIRRHQGARLVRLTQLVEQNKGKINLDIGKEIISDHYDVYLNKENPCSRTVCSHYELDAREYMSQSDRPKPYSPRGAVDGCVIDTNMAKNMSFLARFGSSCGTSFNKDDFFEKHIQWMNFKPYVRSRPSEKWSIFSITNLKKNIKKLYSKKIKNKVNKTKKTIINNSTI